MAYAIKLKTHFLTCKKYGLSLPSSNDGFLFLKTEPKTCGFLEFLNTIEILPSIQGL